MTDEVTRCTYSTMVSSMTRSASHVVVMKRVTDLPRQVTHGKEFKTRVVTKNGLRPRWNQRLELLASHPELALLHIEARSQQSAVSS